MNRGSVHDLKPSESLASLLDDADERERLLAQTTAAQTGREDDPEGPAGTAVVPRPETPRPTARHAAIPEGQARITADTFGEVFDQLLDEHERTALTRAEAERAEHEPAPQAPARRIAPEETVPPAPALAAGPGDLVAVFGLHDDALTAARALAVIHPGISLTIAGLVTEPGLKHVGSRRQATQARADGVRRGSGTLVAVGGGDRPAQAREYAEILEDITPDQVWIAVDVTRKPEDTRLWAEAVARAGAGITALAVLRTAATSTPDSVRLLGIPVGWSDATSSGSTL